MTATKENRLLTSDQVIARLLADATTRRLASTCVLPAVRYGTEWRFRESDLDDWIGRQAHTRPGIAQ
jgi:excisionase family DNA binding protein